MLRPSIFGDSSGCHIATTRLEGLKTQLVLPPRYAWVVTPMRSRRRSNLTVAMGISMTRRMIILTEGNSNPHTAKTACCLIRYKRDEVAAVLDSTQSGTTQQALGVGADVPFIASLSEAPTANTLLIGIAPPGGKIPSAWRSVILEAIERGMDVISGLHDFLGDDPEFAAAADRRGITIRDVRRNDEKTIARRTGLREECLRIHTVGHDCSIGKMVTSVELTHALADAGHDVKFIATGQTGILVEGDGIPVDCVKADFVSGAAERMVLEHQHHEILVIEGQGSLVHPSYSGVTLSLLHGCHPHGLILCYEIGRTQVTGIDHLAIPPLGEILQLNESLASISSPCPVIGISVNSRRVTAAEADSQRDRLRAEFGLPVADVFRDGTQELVDAILELKQQRARVSS